MAETELEKMVVRLVGDPEGLLKSFEDAKTTSTDFTNSVESDAKKIVEAHQAAAKSIGESVGKLSSVLEDLVKTHTKAGEETQKTNKEGGESFQTFGAQAVAAGYLIVATIKEISERLIEFRNEAITAFKQEQLIHVNLHSAIKLHSNDIEGLTGQYEYFVNTLSKTNTFAKGHIRSLLTQGTEEGLEGAQLMQAVRNVQAAQSSPRLQGMFTMGMAARLAHGDTFGFDRVFKELHGVHDEYKRVQIVQERLNKLLIVNHEEMGTAQRSVEKFQQQWDDMLEDIGERFFKWPHMILAARREFMSFYNNLGPFGKNLTLGISGFVTSMAGGIALFGFFKPQILAVGEAFKEAIGLVARFFSSIKSGGLSSLITLNSLKLGLAGIAVAAGVGAVYLIDKRTAEIQAAAEAKYKRIIEAMSAEFKKQAEDRISSALALPLEKQKSGLEDHVRDVEKGIATLEEQKKRLEEEVSNANLQGVSDSKFFRFLDYITSDPFSGDIAKIAKVDTQREKIKELAETLDNLRKQQELYNLELQKMTGGKVIKDMDNLVYSLKQQIKYAGLDENEKAIAMLRDRAKQAGMTAEAMNRLSILDRLYAESLKANAEGAAYSKKKQLVEDEKLYEWERRQLLTNRKLTEGDLEYQRYLIKGGREDLEYKRRLKLNDVWQEYLKILKDVKNTSGGVVGVLAGTTEGLAALSAERDKLVERQNLEEQLKLLGKPLPGEKPLTPRDIETVIKSPQLDSISSKIDTTNAILESFKDGKGNMGSAPGRGAFFRKMNLGTEVIVP